MQSSSCDQPLFNFQLDNGRKEVEIKLSDFARLIQLSENYGWSDLSAAALYEVLSTPDSAPLNYESFASAIVHVSGSSSLGRSALFHTVFESLRHYDHPSGGSSSSMVSIPTLWLSLLCLCRGKVPEKLQCCFYYLSSGGRSQTIDLDHLKSVLLVPLLFQLSVRGASDARELARMCHSTGDELLHRLSNSKYLFDGTISYKDFVDWFSENALTDTPWLELLDLESLKEVLPSLPQCHSACDESPAVASAAAEGISRELPTGCVLRYRLYDGRYLELHSWSLSLAQRLLEESGLRAHAVGSLFDRLDDMSRSSYLSQTMYDSFVTQCILPSCSGSQSRSWLLTQYGALFRSFDPMETGSINLYDFYPGFSIFLEGTKSEKLQHGFQLLDLGSTGSLNRREFRRFLRSYLTVLFFLSGMNPSAALAGCPCPPRRLQSQVDGESAFLTSEIFRACACESSIRFEDFKDWYNRPGQSLCLWLELLDPQKWSVLLSYYPEQEVETDDPRPSLPQLASSAFDLPEESARNQGLQDASDDEYQDFYDYPEVVGVTPSVSDEAPRSSSRRHSVSPSDAVSTAATAGSIHSAAAVSESIPRSYPLFGTPFALELEDPSLQYLDYLIRSSVFARESCDSFFVSMLSFSDNGVVSRSNYDTVLSPYCRDDPLVRRYVDRMFSEFDESNDGTADVLCLCSALSFLFRGSKSEKLYSLFVCFRVSEDDRLSLSRLSKFLQSLLQSLCLLCNSPVDRGGIRVSIDALIAQMSSDVGLTNVSLEDFGQWYNRVGHNHLSWLELLNLSKWPQYETSIEYTFELVPSSHRLVVTPNETHLLDSLVSNFPFESIESLRLCLSNVLEDGGAGASSEEEEEERIVGRSAFESLFLPVSCSIDWVDLYDYLDVDGLCEVPEKDVICLLSFLLPGTKTDKLRFLYSEYSVSGKMGLSESKHYFFVLLTILNYFQPRQNQNLPSVIEHCQFVTAHLCSYNNDRPVSFDDFASWYNEYGFKIVPWIELLDHKKWPIRYDASRLPVGSSESYSSSSVSGSATPSSRGAVTADASAASNPKKDTPAIQAVVAPVHSIPSRKTASVVPIEELRFILNRHGDVLSFTSLDIDRFHSLLSISGLSGLSSRELHHRILAFSSNRALSFQSFLHQFSAMSPDVVRSPELKDLLVRIFLSFDRNETGFVNIQEIASSLSIFCRGDKSTKLSDCFELMSPIGSKSLDRRQCRTFFQSLLITLLCLSHDYGTTGSDQLYKVVEQTVLELLEDLFHSQPSGDDRIEYRSLARWYSEKGYHQIPWIELWSTSKWVHVTQLLPRPMESSSSSFAATAAVPVASSGLTPPIYPQTNPYFRLENDYGPEGVLTIDYNPLDIEHLRDIVDQSNLSMYSPEELVSQFQSGGSLSIVTKAEFHDLLKLVMDSGAYARVRDIFDCLYCYHADRGPVSKHLLLVSLMFFTGGKKSPKLLTAFKLLTGSVSVALTSLQLVPFFFSLLVPMVLSLPSPPTVGFLVSFVSGVVNTLHGALDPSDGSLAYSRFSGWYGEGGYQLVPWIELLDHSKWPIPSPQPSSVHTSCPCVSAAAAPVPAPEDKALVVQQRAANTSSSQTLRLSLGRHSAYVWEVSVRSTNRLDAYLRASSLNHYSCRTVESLMSDMQGSSLPPEECSAFFRSLIPGENLKAYDATVISPLFSLFLESVVMPNGLVEAGAMGSFLVAFSSGSVTEKMSCCFRLHAQGKPSFTHTTLSRCLMHLLLPLLLLTVDDLEPSILSLAFESCQMIASNYLGYEYSKLANIPSIDPFLRWWSGSSLQACRLFDLLDRSAWPSL